MAFVLQDSWQIAGDARLEQVRIRLDKGSRTVLALIATGLLHAGLIAFLMLKLFEPARFDHAGMIEPSLTLVDLSSEAAPSSAVPSPSSPPTPIAPAPQIHQQPVLASEWQLTQLRIRITDASAAASSRVAATIGKQGVSAGSGNGNYDPYSNAGYYPTREAQLAATTSTARPVANSVATVDQTSLNAALEKFRRQRPGARGSASFVLRTSNPPVVSSVTMLGGTLDKASADMLSGLLRASVRVVGPAGRAVEIRLPELQFG